MWYVDVGAIREKCSMLQNHLYKLGFSASTVYNMGRDDLEKANEMYIQVKNMSIVPFFAGKCSITWSTYKEGLFKNTRTTDCVIGYRKVFGDYYVEFKAMDVLRTIIDNDNPFLSENEMEFTLELVKQTCSWMDSFQNRNWYCPQKIAKAGRLLLSLFYTPKGKPKKDITKITLVQFIQKVIEFKCRLKEYNVRY